jgi:hypothetical protein
MSRKIEAFKRDMLVGTIAPHVPNQRTAWEPFTPAKKIPCPKCGKTVRLDGMNIEEHHAANANYVC